MIGHSRSLCELPVAKIDFSDRVRFILGHRRWEPLVGNARSNRGTFCAAPRGLRPECATVCATDPSKRFLARSVQKERRTTKAIGLVDCMVGGLIDCLGWLTGLRFDVGVDRPELLANRAIVSQ